MVTDVISPPVPGLPFVAISAGWGGLLVSGIQRNKINMAFLLKAIYLCEPLFSSRILQSKTALTAHSNFSGSENRCFQARLSVMVALGVGEFYPSVFTFVAGRFLPGS